MDRHEFTGSKQTWLFLTLSLVCLNSASVWLSCQEKMDFSPCRIMLSFSKSSHKFKDIIMLDMTICDDLCQHD